MTTQPLAPGQSITLPNGLGKLTFTGYRQWASLAITYDPGQFPALVSALAALAGLVMSFLVRRRRIFVRVAQAQGEAEGSVVELGGLTRSDAAGGFEVEFAELTSELSIALGPQRDTQRERTEGSEKPVEAGDSPDEVVLAKSKGE